METSQDGRRISGAFEKQQKIGTGFEHKHQISGTFEDLQNMVVFEICCGTTT